MATLRVEIVVDSGQTREMDREFQRFHNPIEIFIGIGIFISLLIRINICVDICWLMTVFLIKR